MNTPDISPLVKGILGIILLAISFGQYPKLEHWARVQAIQALEWKENLPYFFAGPQSARAHSHHHATISRKEVHHE